MRWLADILTSNKYLGLILVLIIFFLIAKIFVKIIDFAVNRAMKQSRIRIKKSLVQRTEGVFIIIMLTIGLLFALKNLFLPFEILDQSLQTVLTLLVAYFLIEISTILLNIWGKNLTRHKGSEFHEEILPLVHSSNKLIISLLTLMLILQIWGVQIWTLLASIGVVGIILGFAFKETMENIFGGISLIMDRTFRAGDVIQLEGEDIIGEVLMINLRSTRIKTYDNKVLIVPNGVLANQKIVNYALPNKILRIKINVSVEYGSDVDKVTEVLLSVLDNYKNILQRQPANMVSPVKEVRMIRMGDYSLDFELIFHIKQYREMYAMRNNVTRDVYKSLNKNNIRIPFPSRTVYQGNSTKIPDRISKRSLSKKSAKKKKKK